MRKTGVLITLALASVLASVLAAEKPLTRGKTEPGTLDRKSLEWIRTEKIRAGYFHRWSPQELPGKLAKADFNTIHVQFCNGGHGQIDRWAELARKNDLRLILGVWWNYPAHRETQQKVPSKIGERYRGFVNGSGRVHTKTVCPTDEKYWLDWVFPDFLAMARKSREADIVGITLDPEFYSSEEPDGGGSYGWYQWAGACCCDSCFGSFLRDAREKKTAADIPAETRGAWLAEGKRSAAYDAHLKKKVEALARRLEQAVHAIDPDVLLGCLAVYEAGDFFARGLRDGFKTAKRPVLIWTETPTYNKGYHAYVDEVYDKFQSLGNVVYVPGLNLAKHAPATLSKQAHDLALHSDGYWVFSQQKKRFLEEANLRSFKSGNGQIVEALSKSELKR